VHSSTGVGCYRFSNLRTPDLIVQCSGMQCRGSGSVMVPIDSPIALALLEKCVVDHIMNGVVVKTLHSHAACRDAHASNTPPTTSRDWAMSMPFVERVALLTT
jgi:hypothetical protein